MYSIYDEILIPQSMDERLLQKLIKCHAKPWSKFKTVLWQKNNFIIDHLSGSVTYSIDGFVQKNQDSIVSNLW